MSTSRKPLDHYLEQHYPFQVITGSDAGYFVMFPDLPGCMTQADTIDEIGPMAEEARRLWIEVEYDQGHDIPEPSAADEYSGKFNLRIPRSLHQRLAWSCEREGVSLNQYVLTLLARGDAQARVERKLDELAAGVAAVSSHSPVTPARGGRVRAAQPRSTSRARPAAR